MCKRLGGQMLAAAKANFEPERGGPVWKLARGIGNGLRRIKGKTRQSRAQKQGLMSAQLLPRRRPCSRGAFTWISAGFLHQRPTAASAASRFGFRYGFRGSCPAAQRLICCY